MRRRAAVLSIVVLCAVAAFRGAGRLLVVADPLPARADAIVVLAGAPAGRTIEAATLFAREAAPTVVLTRERRPAADVAAERLGAPGPDPTAAARHQLVALGVPEAAIRTLAGRAYSTSSEAALVARWACRTRVQSLIVVTSPSHTRRARLILRALLGPSIALAVVPAPADFFPARHWWRSRRAAKLVLSEYQKLANFWLRERWTLRPCGR